MNLTSRKKRPLERSEGFDHDAILIVIATEGEKTEKNYLKMFRSSKVKIEVLHTTKGFSAPKHVFKRLHDFKEEHNLDKDDQLWLMIDVDDWPKDKLTLIGEECNEIGLRLAVSNPCFELWLFLHLSDAVPDWPFSCKEIKKKLSAILKGYNSSNLQTDKFKPHIKKAIKNAKKLDINPVERWPAKAGTHVYKVVNEILKLIR